VNGLGMEGILCLAFMNFSLLVGARLRNILGNCHCCLLCLTGSDSNLSLRINGTLLGLALFEFTSI